MSLLAAPLLALLAQLGSGQGVAEARALGGGGCGRLEGGSSLPCSGRNFEAFSDAACATGRNFLHPLVQQTVVDAYRALELATPKRHWQYGEMGREHGGPLWPHRTHQNGLSADFFVPVVGSKLEPVLLPISPLNKFGYGLELDRRGRLQELSIDLRALGQHLLALEAAGADHQVRLERIILTPDFHERLLRDSPLLRRLAPLLMKTEAWVRHDEHYHVDFAIPDRLRGPLRCERR